MVLAVHHVEIELIVKQTSADYGDWLDQYIPRLHLAVSETVVQHVEADVLADASQPAETEMTVVGFQPPESASWE
jgi:hypothetical protein